MSSGNKESQWLSACWCWRVPVNEDTKAQLIILLVWKLHMGCRLYPSFGALIPFKKPATYIYPVNGISYQIWIALWLQSLLRFSLCSFSQCLSRATIVRQCTFAKSKGHSKRPHPASSTLCSFFMWSFRWSRLEYILEHSEHFIDISCTTHGVNHSAVCIHSHFKRICCALISLLSNL